MLLVHHSLELRVLCLMKCSSKMLQNLLFLSTTYMKTHVVFSFFDFEQLYISTL